MTEKPHQEDPSEIWLEPWCGEDSPEGRQWCENDAWGRCPECDASSVRYVRADLAIAPQPDVDALAEALRKCKHVLDGIGRDYALKLWANEMAAVTAASASARAALAAYTGSLIVSAGGLTGEGAPEGWRPIETAPEGVLVWTKIHDADGERNVAKLRRRGRLWFVPDGSMYVYYQPTHWTPDAPDTPSSEGRP